MTNEREPLLPIINEKIETNKRDWISDVEVGPRYEDNKWRWFLVNLLRMFIFVVTFIFTWISSIYFIWYFNVPDFIFGIFFILYMQIVWPPILLLLSFVFGQFNFFYLLCCYGFIYKHILSREYILNRIAESSSSSSSS